MTTKTEVGAKIRWMNSRDLPEVVDIEKESFEFAWTDEDFKSVLRERNVIGMVCEHTERIRGFMVYALEIDRLHILNFAVAPWARRRGFGEEMVCKLLGKLTGHTTKIKRNRIVLEVRETNLEAQLFFKAMKFEATECIRGHYDDTAEDAYRFVYEV
jgi:ribosomal-protein-alanine N-acetyltransferase